MGTVRLDPLPRSADPRLELWPRREVGGVSVKQQAEQDSLARVHRPPAPAGGRGAHLPGDHAASLSLAVPELEGSQVRQGQRQLIVGRPRVTGAVDRGELPLSSLPQDRRAEGRDRLEVADRGMLPVEEGPEGRCQLRGGLAPIHRHGRDTERLVGALHRDLPAPLGQPAPCARLEREDLHLEPCASERRGEAPRMGPEPQRRIGSEFMGDEGHAHRLTIEGTRRPGTGLWSPRAPALPGPWSQGPRFRERWPRGRWPRR